MSKDIPQVGPLQWGRISLAQGGKVRQDGRIISVPLAYKTRPIDFGDGEKLAGLEKVVETEEPEQPN